MPGPLGHGQGDSPSRPRSDSGLPRKWTAGRPTYHLCTPPAASMRTHLAFSPSVIAESSEPHRAFLTICEDVLPESDLGEMDRNLL